MLVQGFLNLGSSSMHLSLGLGKALSGKPTLRNFLAQELMGIPAFWTDNFKLIALKFLCLWIFWVNKLNEQR